MGEREQQNDTTSTAPPSRGVGALLREARQRRSISLELASQNLRIRRAVLEAMEAGQFEKLPNGAYAIGFLRSYADFLGLDRDEIVRRVKAEAAALGAKTELIFPQAISESRLPSGVVVAVSVLLAGSAYGLWYYHTAGDRTAITRVDPIPEQLAPNNSGTMASRAQPSPIAVPPPAIAAAPPAAAPVVTSAPPPASVAAPAPAPAPAASPEPSQLAALPSPVESPRQFGEATRSRIVIKATGDSWLQVRDAAGSVVFSRILKAGESYAAPDQPGHVFATGSAGMLDIVVDGKKAPAVGRPGFIRRDVPLDPVRLLAGTTAAEPSPPAATPAAPAPAATPQERPTDG